MSEVKKTSFGFGTLSGTARIGADPRVNNFESKDGNEVKVTTLSAVYSTWVGQNKDPISTWVNLVVRGARADYAAKAKKGDTVTFSGQLIARPYEKDGMTRQSLDVNLTELTVLSKNAADTAPKAEVPAEEEVPF